jgi:hypothetical protein
MDASPFAGILIGQPTQLCQRRMSIFATLGGTARRSRRTLPRTERVAGRREHNAAVASSQR